MSRQNGSFTATEANFVTISFTNTRKVDRVTIQEEFANFTVGKLNFFFTAPAEFEHRAILALFFSTDSACSEHITSAHVATSDSMVSNSLCDRVVQIFHV